ncbi:MAG: DNA-binding protein [Balneolaceae bacterium]|nr:MAG: DNA-binding protein [Balneolaceae bacterium]
MKSIIQIADTIGNKELLSLKKTTFLCSRKIPAQAILTCYDWAIQQRENNNCVISGFHSKIEKDVFHYLAKGKQPIIMALPRGLKTKWEPEIQELLKTGRLLIVTPFGKDIKRITKDTAAIRNQLMIELADEIVVGFKSPDGNLESMISSNKISTPIIFLV